MEDGTVSCEIDDGTAIVRLDDGKANALSYDVLEALGRALDRAEEEQARAPVLNGRPGRFSAGVELSVLRQGVQQAMALALNGAELAIRLFEFPMPVVLGVSGHALAMGAVLCLAGDERIGARGEFKIGLNEVAIGMTLPDFAIEFARERLSRRHLGHAVHNAHMYTPETAVDAGFLDRVVEPERVPELALARARDLGSTLDARAHRDTKRALRAGAIARLRQSVAEGRARL